MILYLTYWFPARERARAVARFMTATAIAGVVGGPLSGLLLSQDGRFGFAGWQWLFVVEGLPAVALGAAVLAWLPDRPGQVDWLSSDEKAWLEETLAQERALTARHGHDSLRAALTNRVVWLLGLLYLCVVICFYVISFWLPQILQGLSGLSDVAVAVVSALPYLAAAIGMVWVAGHSDRTGERVRHVAWPLGVGATGMILAALPGPPAAALAALGLAATGIWSALGPFWTLPTRLLTGTAAAGGIALVNSLGNLGGFLGPYLVGWLRDVSGGFAAPLIALAMFPVMGAFLALSLERELGS
jgi:ACS family tartrate transporter-like MFS transporter